MCWSREKLGGPCKGGDKRTALGVGNYSMIKFC